MIRFVTYFALLLIYVMISKTLLPEGHDTSYIRGPQDLEQLIPDYPASAILVDEHATGFAIKTYYQKYRLVYAMDRHEELIVRTSRGFALESKKFIGLELFRRDESGRPSTTPLPPGGVFINNSAYGRWRGDKWRFYRAYRHLPALLGWRNFRPTQEMWQQLEKAKEEGTPYFGPPKLFGPDGKITRKSFPNFFNLNFSQRDNLRITDLLRSYFSIPGRLHE